MGFHICEYCKPDAENQFSNLSSGDTTLVFDSGRVWRVPDMILHYVADHEYQPDELFIEDVMKSNLVAGERLQTKAFPTPLGYLHGDFKKGKVPDGFIRKLQIVLKVAEAKGSRVQYRSM